MHDKNMNIKPVWTVTQTDGGCFLTGHMVFKKQNK